jgi:hypothetical protein
MFVVRFSFRCRSGGRQTRRRPREGTDGFRRRKSRNELAILRFSDCQPVEVIRPAAEREIVKLDDVDAGFGNGKIQRATSAFDDQVSSRSVGDDHNRLQLGVDASRGAIDNDPLVFGRFEGVKADRLLCHHAVAD